MHIARIMMSVVGLLGPQAIRASPHSLIISVDEPSPRRVGNRMPAKIALDFRELLGSPSARVNPQSLKLWPVDAAGNKAGQPVPVRFDDPDPKPDSFF
jgi:hypothetical protein